MHSCKETRERLTELILDGRSDEALPAELNKCTECRDEFDALNATLRMAARVRETAVPAESYWPGYHATLHEKLSHAKVRRRKENTGASFASLRFGVKTLLWPVPVPLGIAALIVCLVGVFAFRTTQRRVAPPEPVVVHVPVQVPVVQEKVITRVVYRDRYLPTKASQRTRADSGGENIFAKSQQGRSGDVPTLAGFKPAEDVKLTVIKGGSPNEK